MASMPSSTVSLLGLLVNHIALPPQLPGRRDSSVSLIEDALASRLRDGSRILRDLTIDESSHQWDCLSSILQTCRIVNGGGKLDSGRLLTEFSRLESKSFIILHIAEQNAGLLLYRFHDGERDVVIFEAFEASPVSEQALAAANALLWDFPGIAVALPHSDFQKRAFQESLALFLEQASVESIKNFAAHTTKAGSFAFESRGTADPSLITQILMTVIEANGYRVFPKVLRKRVRDDVCWINGAEIPWRRSPYWLVLRVGIQRYLYLLHGAEVGRLYYKFLLCVMLAQLIVDSIDALTPELLFLLKAKLGRRLAKLEAEKGRVTSRTRSISEVLFRAVSSFFLNSMKLANEKVKKLWDDFKQRSQRPIPTLPHRADHRDLTLTLSNSGAYLDQVLSWHQVSESSASKPVITYQIPKDLDKIANSRHLSAFFNRYYCLSDLEEEVEKSYSMPLSTSDYGRKCTDFAERIEQYLDTVGDAYEGNPEQKSVMLLTVMRLWVLMDRCATKAFDLLLDYDTGIPAEILDVLQVLSFMDMNHLHQIQLYLKERKNRCGVRCKTIFDDPIKGCFAERYFNESIDAQQLQDLYGNIERTAKRARLRKEEEWVRLSAEFQKLERQIAGSTCIYTTDFHSVVVHDDRNCTKCFLQQRARRMRIGIHEHPLPDIQVHAKAVVFELRCPHALRAYRNVTWRIIGSLAQPEPMNGKQPQLMLFDYSELIQFMNFQNKAGFSLASTRKSFLSTHYKKMSLPVELDKVCMPNGLRLAYYDPRTGLWPGQQIRRQTFVHHCSMIIPERSPFSQLQSSLLSAAESHGPSSYDIIASQTRCPSGLNTHEFTAYQALFSGESQRWLVMMIEFGSSNLNFSLEATASLMSYLAVQAGPTHETDLLRVAHRIFRDISFCKNLIEQVEKRLRRMSNNWREANCLWMLLTLILRLYFIGPRHIRHSANRLLDKTREVTLGWIRNLRSEIHKCTDAENSRILSSYSFWAALIGRRTFTVYAKDADSEHDLDPLSLACFIECSITLQDNLINTPSALSTSSRNALISDIKMVHQIRQCLRKSLGSDPNSLEAAIHSLWPQQEGTSPELGNDVGFLSAPYEWWIVSTFRSTPESRHQILHYHLLEGCLLVDGKPLGKLPATHRESMVLQQLFGKQNLLTYPSGLPGMMYMLAFGMNGHQIHLGFRNNALIIQACYRGSIFELIPEKIFTSNTDVDLPASLRENCVHWLNLDTGVLEIRQRPDIWKFKGGNWRLDVNRRIAQRRRSTLVDPCSPLYQRVARMFDYFEHRDRLTVFQPEKGHLSVELRRLELSFYVNYQNILHCRQLRAEIDPNQDPGTWYGLRSKLILRDPVNPSQRSIIVPMGPIAYRANNFHVNVNVENHGDYGIFSINSVLGRLDCPAEPRLLYMKAQLHAYTSFVVPDPLTGRTGTEEALHWLKSGCCQPWTPLNPGPLCILESIAKLTPKREYYPKDMRVMQNTSWDSQLTTTIQNDQFRPTVQAIYEKSSILSLFSLEKSHAALLDGDSYHAHLEHRSIWRRSVYERQTSVSLNKDDVPSDLPYDTRDRFVTSQARRNVFEITRTIRNWPQEIASTKHLASILQDWPNIAGYDRTFDKPVLSDCLNVYVPSEWGSLVTLCRMSSREHAYKLMFLFATMSFRDGVDMEILQTLVAFAFIEDLKLLRLPEWPYYLHFRYNHIPNVDYLKQLMKPCCVPYPEDERSTFGGNLHPKLRRKLEIAERAHIEQVEKDCTTLAEFFLEQWPCSEPQMKEFDYPLQVDVTKTFEIICPEWLRLFQNIELSTHIRQVQQILDSHRTEIRIKLPKYQPENHLFEDRSRSGEMSNLWQDILSKAGTAMPTERYLIPWPVGVFSSPNQEANAPKPRQKATNNAGVSPSSEILELEKIIQEIGQSTSAVDRKYVDDLLHSLNMLKVVERSKIQKMEHTSSTCLSKALVSLWVSQMQQRIHDQFDILSLAFEQGDPRVPWLKAGGLWPCITPVAILECLRSTLNIRFENGIKGSIMQYALSIVDLQHLLRIEDALLRGDNNRISQEMKDPGHVNWKPIEHPGWVLLEIEANIIIRKDQVEVAFATMSPVSRSNSVLQMNIGQGKTSCIMPMVAAELADTTRLLRVVVPKPLLLQTAQLLQTRLGGLLGREVRHVPFSRRTATDRETIQKYAKIHKEIMANSGVVVALPEHILSFMLSGLQRLSDSRFVEAKLMIKVQEWMQKACRDILDECDYTLSVRTQLIYPSGSQTMVDGNPHRWHTAQAVLRLVAGHLWNLQQDFPGSIEVIQRPHGGFPLVYFLHKDVEDALLGRLAKDVIQGQISTLQTGQCTELERLAIKHFISDATVQLDMVEQVQRIFSDNRIAMQTIHLLRGFIVHRILLLTLKKRWNVQYGLHPNRVPIAVPYHAKGVPSDQAEWGHPDVAILFTCLAFYFGGLDREQLRQSLGHILKSDDPSSEYDRWIEGSTIPESLREVNGISVDDEAQLIAIWRHVRYNVATIDYFLNNLVFPKHSKQFQTKLQASGWDIPLFSPQRMQMPLTTGFSGTNDNRTMLPLMIKQEDLPALSHTNAEVLTYLLQPRNRAYVVAADMQGRHTTEIDLLRLLSKSGIRVLIDAGAQILEMDNLSLAKAWLTVDHEAPAAVYFDEGNKPFVIYRNESRIPLLASPYADNLGDCLVYLDEAHTRGTDLKMQANARGALTLGLGQTKDHTVQAAMRLRQLATTQSVTFIAPPEVHHSILDHRKQHSHHPIDSHDVISWLLKQTCSGIEQMLPLYFSHGVDFCRRIQAVLDYSDFLTNSNRREEYLGALRRTEKQTLEQLYAPRSKGTRTAHPAGGYAPEIGTFIKQLNIRRKQFQDIGSAVHSSALQEVEQEREVAFEVETVREVQKPVHFTPLSFPCLHKDIIRFVETGGLVSDSDGYEHAFVTLKRTSLGKKYGINRGFTGSRLFVSKEFMRTVKLPLSQANDSFLRAVNWILWSKLTETALVIIPEEAELLIPIICDKEDSEVYLLTYAAPVTRNMLHFNDLRYFTIPPLPDKWRPPNWLTIELGILAGRLYFEFEEYDALCHFLGINLENEHLRSLNGPISSSKASNLSIDEGAEDQGQASKNMIVSQSFTAKPLIFLQEWLAIRRKGGQDFSQTPMGYVCQGKPLAAKHPFFSKHERSGASDSDSPIGRSNGDVRVSTNSDPHSIFDSDGERLEDGDGYLDNDDEWNEVIGDDLDEGIPGL